jgi:ABC-type multidrug transport system, ATPase component
MKNKLFLSVEGLSKHYGNISAVDNVCFSVYQQEIFGLLGPNGAGKTTIIKMLCGILKTDSGDILFDGISLLSKYDQIKDKIGLCPQDIIIWEQLTCFEQLKFVGISYGLSSRIAGERADNLLEELGLSSKKNKLAGTLSGGMQRRLNIALALIHDPQLIILDEPHAGLDPQSRVIVRDFIRQLAKRKSVILTTHDMDEADRLSDRVAIIDHGRILTVDTPDKIKVKFGMGDVIQVSVNEMDREKIDSLLNIIPPAFFERKYADGILLLGANEPISLIPIVNQILKDLNIHANNMTIRKRTLEDAFISMTGRGLRE